jgi:hypothetical protein
MVLAPARCPTIQPGRRENKSTKKDHQRRTVSVGTCAVAVPNPPETGEAFREDRHPGLVSNRLPPVLQTPDFSALQW